MLAKVCSAAVNGIEAYPVEVEVNAGFGDTIIVMIESQKPLFAQTPLRPLFSTGRGTFPQPYRKTASRPISARFPDLLVNTLTPQKRP